ncbi:kinase domain-containing protein [Phialemonium atrogriseum]|uniref:non-specific serine/threonine protein kinase n=1 Tax=Phialemonium atrogriseum TaxID=1093897 RepID=A0AAJ0FJ93_9PEZI|nr:kinase domain-containing protein [Phialemonium atrogriseum]KAK1770396.1 kinase domain-containing protein [Phialemonium atrogriseum]
MSQVEILPPFLYRQPRMEHIEDVGKYVPGGYHPVDIGDIIGTSDQSYEVIHKLGYGGFSTVWLVRSCGDMHSYFALKILCADVPNVNELNVLQYLRKSASPHANVVTLHDSFKVSGPNGEHHCLVFPVLDPSLQNPRVADALPGPTRYQVCCQVTSAIAFLHGQGICHGGSIKAEDLKLPNGSYSPHAPKQVVQTPEFSGLDYSSLAFVRIVVFGQAFFADRPPPSLGVPIDFFPPELCFGYLPSTKSDIWQLACILYIVHAKVPMFSTFFRIFGILIGTVVGYLGPLPQQWKGRFMFEKYGYREPGRAQSRTEPAWWFEDKHSEKSIDSRLFQEAPHLSVRQKGEYVRLLHDMVAYEPEQRLSAADAVQRLRSAAFLDE